MKMKQLIIIMVALVIAALIFGTVMFFTKNDLQNAINNPKSGQESTDINKELEEIPNEFIFMQVNTSKDGAKGSSGFLFDKYGKFHYFDVNVSPDSNAGDIYDEAIKQRNYYEPVQYIAEGDIPTLYKLTTEVDPDAEIEEIPDNSEITTETYYAIKSDGVKTYPVLIFADGKHAKNSKDESAKTLQKYFLNLHISKIDEDPYVPVPSDSFIKEMSSSESSDTQFESSPESAESSVIVSKTEESSGSTSEHSFPEGAVIDYNYAIYGD